MNGSALLQYNSHLLQPASLSVSECTLHCLTINVRTIAISDSVMALNLCGVRFIKYYSVRVNCLSSSLCRHPQFIFVLQSLFSRNNNAITEANALLNQIRERIEFLMMRLSNHGPRLNIYLSSLDQRTALSELVSVIKRL